MPALEPLLVTRRLRREINAQVEVLHRDIERAKFTTAQLRRTAFARATSPQGLAATAAAGFIFGKFQLARGRKPAHIAANLGTAALGAASGIVTTVAAAARSALWQLLLPAAIDWVRNKFQFGVEETNSPQDPR